MSTLNYSIPNDLDYYFEGIFLKEILKDLKKYDEKSKNKITYKNYFQTINQKYINLEIINCESIKNVFDINHKVIKKTLLISKLKTILIKKKLIFNNYKKLKEKKNILLVGPIEKTKKIKIDGYNIIHSYYFDENKMISNAKNYNCCKNEKILIGSIIESIKNVDYIITTYNFDKELIKKFNILKLDKFNKKNIDYYLIK